MEPRDTPVPERIAGAREGRRSAATTFTLIAAILAVAIVKPWDESNSGGFTPAAMATPSPAPAHPTPSPQASQRGAEDRLAEVCLEPSGWRILATEVWRDQVIRSWRATEPSVADGPLDPAIAFAPVAAEAVPILGYCAPISGPDEPPQDARGSVFAIQPDGGVRELDLERSVPPDDVSGGAGWVGPAEGEPAFGAAGGKPGRTWPVARYVIRIATTDGRYERWIGVEILRPFVERR
jgi:hypothetical protein